MQISKRRLPNPHTHEESGRVQGLHDAWKVASNRAGRCCVHGTAVTHAFPVGVEPSPRNLFLSRDCHCNGGCCKEGTVLTHDSSLQRGRGGAPAWRPVPPGCNPCSGHAARQTPAASSRTTHVASPRGIADTPARSASPPWSASAPSKAWNRESTLFQIDPHGFSAWECRHTFSFQGEKESVSIYQDGGCGR